MLPVTHRNWAELCLGISCGGTGQQWTATGARALGAADLGMNQGKLEVVKQEIAKVNIGILGKSAN